MNDLNMNRLPVPTWNQCGVNSAPKAAALPAVPADDWGEVNLAFTLPAGVGEAEEDFTTFAESGMGAETDAFLLGNANVRSALTVAEGVEVNDPVQFEVTHFFVICARCVLLIDRAQRVLQHLQCLPPVGDAHGG